MLINCTECGRQVSDKAAACPNCGAPVLNRFQSVQGPVIVSPSKSRSAAVLLAILLGGIGIHKFYLNKPGWGVVYILFSWTFIPAILGVLEGLAYLFTSDEEFQKKYG